MTTQSPQNSRHTDETFAAAVTAGLARTLQAHQEHAASISASAAPMIEAIAALASGGKRLRALLCWWGWRSCGGDPDDPTILEAAVGLELFQTAALIHDDIVDRSDTRRGAPSVHRSFESLHRESGWSQDAGHFGTSAALLTGDLCLALSEQSFSRAAAGTPQASAARERFETMRFEVMVGQYLDVLDEVEIPTRDPALALQRARTVLTHKSAHYSVVHPLALGGILAGAHGEQVQSWAAFSEPLGEAYQLQDDLLGVFGDPAVTGKPAGDDLREGKRTALVAHALRLFDEAQVDRLESALGRADLTDSEVATLQEDLIAAGVRDRAEQEIVALGERSLQALAILEVTDQGRQGLQDLAGRILQRRR